MGLAGPSPKRLQAILADSGIASRRKAEELMTAGRVSVDGEIIRELGSRYLPGAHDIRLDGKPIAAPPATGVWMLNKPVGVTCTRSDPHAKRTLRDLWGKEGDRAAMQPVGRLDRDSRGLLLLTNDGELLYRLTHPRWQVRRVYEATLAGPYMTGLLPILRAGVEIQGKLARPDEVDVIRHDANSTVVRMILREGRKREVRRLCAAAGYDVLDLLRTEYGPIRLGELRPGTIQTLGPPLRDQLYREVDLDPPRADAREA